MISVPLAAAVRWARPFRMSSYLLYTRAAGLFSNRRESPVLLAWDNVVGMHIELSVR